jgi:uncharacterized membrane-anchored protein YhcB (DUF1043 family)
MLHNNRYNPYSFLQSKQAVLVAVIFALLNFVFIWQGIDSMFSEEVNHKNTIFRLLLIALIFVCLILFFVYIWLLNKRNENELLKNELQENETNLNEIKNELYNEIRNELICEFDNALIEVNEIKRKLEQKRNEIISEQNEIKENLAFELFRTKQINESMKAQNENSITIPHDYDCKRNRFVFVEQKGNNGNTAYQYAYYEIDTQKDMLIIGKANFNRKIAQTSEKRDSMGRKVADIIQYAADCIEVFIQAEVPFSQISEPYKTAICLGSLKTETAQNILKQLADNAKLQQNTNDTILLE